MQIASNIFIKFYASTFLQLSYLAAFSCELAWLLESNGDLPVASYLLCVLFSILFVAACILIHGLTTVSVTITQDFKFVDRGLITCLYSSQSSVIEVASWAILIGVLCIPELIFVAQMISDHWVRN